MFKRIFLAAIVALCLNGTAHAMNRQTVVYAGGCFWSMQKAFDGLKGVIATRAGYMGGHVANPTYAIVTAERSGHLESVEVVYDADTISFEALTNHYWRHIDPLTLEGQFCDFAPSYHSAIFTYDDSQYKTALKTKAEVAAYLKRPVVTLVLKVSDLKLKAFYPAEAYHQHFYRKNKAHYENYARGCGRAAKLKAIWGDLAGK